jgi:hypothetical protein
MCGIKGLFRVRIELLTGRQSPAYGVANEAGSDGPSFRTTGMDYRSCAAADFHTTGVMALEPHFQHH